MRFFRLLMVAALLLTSYAGTQTARREKDWLSYEPAVVQLEGKLTIVMYYGPPNYGENPETDAKEMTPILVLPRPVNVRGDPNDELNSESVEGVKQVQLVFYERPAYRQLVGRQVVVKGTLFHSHTAHHHTPVLMTVTEIRKKTTTSGKGDKKE